MIDGYVITFGENGNRLPDVCLPAPVVLFVSQETAISISVLDGSLETVVYLP
jgi:hypothetical protein